MKRLFALIVLSVGQVLACAATPENLSGTWTAWICPKGVQQDAAKCSNFMLELHQRDGKLCGAHMFATPGATRMDEGAPPSVSGEVNGASANVIVASGRVPARLPVELTLARGGLEWRRLQNPSGDYLLPLTARLTRSKSKTLFAPVFAQELKAACLIMFTALREQQSRQPAVQEKPAQ